MRKNIQIKNEQNQMSLLVLNPAGKVGVWAAGNC